MPSIHRVIARALSALLALAITGAPLRSQQPLTLRQAVEQAQAHSYRAQAAQATRDAAHFRDQAFNSRQLPQLSLSGTLPAYNRSIIQVLQPDGTTDFRPQDQLTTSLTATLSQGVPLTGGDLFVSSSLSRLSVSGQQTFRSYSSTPVSIGLRQPVFRSNSLGWDRKEQPVRAELAERQYREAREDIALATTNLFFDVFAARVGLDNAVKNAAVNDTLYKLNQGRYQVGRIGENDLLQSELALLRARNSADGARLEYQRALAALRLGLQLPEDTPLEIEPPTDIPGFQVDTTRAVAEALRNRATISDAELQAIVADRRVSEARFNSGAGAVVSASYGFNASSSALSSAYQDLREARQFTVSVEIPLVQWGAHREGVEAARADRDRVTSNTRAALEQTAQDAYFAALQLLQARRNLELSAKADTVADRRFEVAYNRYVVGRITIDNLYIAQSEKDQALSQYVQALRGYWLAHYGLRRLTLFDFEAGQPIW